MTSFGLSDSAKAIHQRIGPNARYGVFSPPEVRNDAARPPKWRVGRMLWLASVALLAIVLVLAVLVALGF